MIYKDYLIICHRMSRAKASICFMMATPEFTDAFKADTFCFGHHFPTENSTGGADAREYPIHAGRTVKICIEPVCQHGEKLCGNKRCCVQKETYYGQRFSPYPVWKYFRYN